MPVEFDWDLEKARLNFAKHGVTLTAACDAVLDPFRVERIDNRLDYGEERLQIIGANSEDLLFVVTISHAEDHYRIISARRANRKKGPNIVASPEDHSMTKTDWDRLRAMTEEEINAAALSDPDCPPSTDEQLARFKRVNAVKDIRRRLDMTQAQFAETFRLPLATVRDWEQERSHPDAPARALLTAIARDPQTMMRLIGGQAA